MVDTLLFGAAFDPPHLGHLMVAEEVLKRRLTREVWLVPCRKHAFAKNMSDTKDRLAMVKLLERAGIVVSTIELERKGTSYAYDTLGEVRRLCPGRKVGWLMGSDQLLNFHKWYKYKELLVEYPVYVYPRKGYPFKPWYPGMILIEKVPMLTISSREVRERYTKGGNVGGLVLPEVAQYIKQNKLWIM